MEITCDCGKFRARLNAFPKATPGRLVCYCDDCQAYLKQLKREELLDQNGGTEVIPAYPADVDILSGREHLACLQLTPGATHRFYATCCNTPIVNTRPNAPWAGFTRNVYPRTVEDVLGPVRSRIMGKFAKGTPPAGTAAKFNLKAILSVMPFMLKGKMAKKSNPSPFYGSDGVTPVVTPRILTTAERDALRRG